MVLLAFLTEPASMKPILDHLGLPTEPPRVAPARAPPEQSFDFDQRPRHDPSAPEPMPDESRDGRGRAKQDARAEYELEQRVSW